MVNSCYYEQREELLPGDEPISFASDVRPIFENNCSICHPDIVPSPDLRSGSAYGSLIGGGYVNTDEPESSILYQRLIGNPSVMPPSGSLPPGDINTVLSWIQQGAQNN